MTLEKISEKLENYRNALLRLNEALTEKESNQFIVDAVIKRFEFTYELAWKLMKVVIEYKGGEDVKFPRDIFKEAFAKGLLPDGEIWLKMMADRNLMSHTYNQDKAKEIYLHIKNDYWRHLNHLAELVKGEIAN